MLIFDCCYSKFTLIPADDRAKQSYIEGHSIVTGTEFLPCKPLTESLLVFSNFFLFFLWQKNTDTLLKLCKIENTWFWESFFALKQRSMLPLVCT